MKLYKSYTVALETGCGNLYATHATDVNGKHEILLTLGKSGGCIGAHLSTFAILLTEALNSNNPLLILSKCCGLKCINMPCCVDATARHFIDFILQKEEVIEDEK